MVVLVFESLCLAVPSGNYDRFFWGVIHTVDQQYQIVF